MTRWIFPLLCFVACVASAAETEKDKRLPAMGGAWGVRPAAKANPALPHVLLIGDSIANGYSASVTKALDGKANVDLWITPTSRADKTLPKKIADICAAQKYAVIHLEAVAKALSAPRAP